MSDVTIESIAIEITASADEADKALQRLSQSLATLKSAVSGGLEGTSKVAKSLKELAEGAKAFEGVNADKIRSVAEALDSLKNIGQIPDLSKLAKAVKDISSAANGINSADMSTFGANMQSFVSAVQPLSVLQGMGDFSSAINALNKLPKVVQNLQGVNLGTFAQQMQQITAAIQPFATQMQQLSTTFNGLPAPVQQAVTSLSNYGTAANNAHERTDRLGKSLKLLNFTAMYFAIRKVVNVLGTFVKTSNEYVENLNLFNVTMGEGAEEALNFANRVNELMGIDVSQWIQNQGVFNQMASGFGIVGEKANLLSKNLTQLGYDISSYYNISVESAMEKLQSAMAGQVMPLRSLGYAIDEATLKQVALNHGITESVTNMSQAQKAQLRYIAIMEQSSNAMGDMARTIDSPANQLRILESRIMTLKRSIGDSLMPVISAALPYVTAFVKLVGEGFRALADLLGFKVPEFDYSDLMQKSNEDIAESFDEATAASKRFKGTLASIDQLNIIGSKKETSGAGDLAGFDLDLELPSYDFLGNLQEETDKAYETLKKFWDNIKPIVEGIAAGIAAAFVIDKVSDFVTGVKNIADAFKTLNSTRIGKIASSIVATVTAFVSFKRIVKDLTTGKGSVGELAIGIGAVAAAVGAFIAVKNPLGAVLTLVGAGVGAIVGAIQGWNEKQKQLNEELAKSIIYADNGGISISGLAKGYESYFDQVTSSYDETLKTNAALEENTEKIKAATTEIENITSKYRDMNSVMTSDDAETIKTNIKTIGELAKDWLGKETSDLIDTLTTKFSTFAQQLGADIEELSGMLRVLKGIGDTKIDQATKRMDELVDSLTSGELKSEEAKAALDELTELSQKFAVPDVTAESLSFANALEEMRTAAVNFSAEDAIEAIQNVGEKADAARSKLEEAKTSQLVNLENLKAKYISLGVDVEFDAMMKEAGIDFSFDKLMEQIKSTLEAGYAAELKKIDVGEATFYAQIQGQLDTSFADDYVWKKIKDAAIAKGLSREDALRLLKESDFIGLYDAYIHEFMGTDTAKTLQETIDTNLKGLKYEGAAEAGKMLVESMANGTINGQEDFNNALNALAIGGLDELQNLLDKIPVKIKTELEFAPFTDEYKTKLSVDLPNYTTQDAEKLISAPWRGTWAGGMQTVQQPKYEGADTQAMSNAGQAWAERGVPVQTQIVLQNYLEVDGDTIAEKTIQYEQRQMAYSNGRDY